MPSTTATELRKLAERFDEFLRAFYEAAVFRRLDSFDDFKKNLNRFAVFTCGGAVIGVVVAKLVR